MELQSAAHTTQWPTRGDTANLRSLRWRRERPHTVHGSDTRSCTPATTAPIAVPTIQLHLNNTTNPPPVQVMVKPAVMLRREERPTPVSFSVTDAAQLSRTLSEMGSGSGAILLSSGRRDQALDISSEVMSVAEGVHQILIIPWNGKERTTFSMEEGETGSHYEYVWAHGTSPAGVLGILSENLVRPSAQDLKVEGTEMVQATAVYGSCTIACKRSLLRQSSDQKHTPMEWWFAAQFFPSISTTNAISGTRARSMLSLQEGV